MLSVIWRIRAVLIWALPLFTGGVYFEASARENHEGVHAAFLHLCQEVWTICSSTYWFVCPIKTPGLFVDWDDLSCPPGDPGAGRRQRGETEGRPPPGQTQISQHAGAEEEVQAGALLQSQVSHDPLMTARRKNNTPFDSWQKIWPAVERKWFYSWISQRQSEKRPWYRRVVTFYGILGTYKAFNGIMGHLEWMENMCQRSRHFNKHKEHVRRWDGQMKMNAGAFPRAKRHFFCFGWDAWSTRPLPEPKYSEDAALKRHCQNKLCMFTVQGSRWISQLHLQQINNILGNWF